MADKLDLTLHALAAETSDSTGTSVDIGLLRRAVIIDLEVVLVAGTTPTLVVELQTSSDDANFRTMRKFDKRTTPTKRERFYIFGAEQFVRAKWTITGTAGPSFTFSLLGEAHVIYAEPEDSNRPRPVVNDFDVDFVTEKFVKASSEAEGYLAGGFNMPLTDWGEDLREHVANMADFALLKKRGFDPEGADEVVRMGRKDAIQWLSKVSTGAVKPPSIIDATPDILETGVFTNSQIKRGWNDRR